MRLDYFYLFGIASLWAFAAPVGAADFDFDSKVAHVFITHCVVCHNSSQASGGLDLTSLSSLQKGGDSGAVIEAGQPADSYLLERVREGSMPPEGHAKPLSKEEIAGLAQWIEKKLPWPQGRVLDPFELTTDTRAGYDWWSLQPVKKAQVPTENVAESQRRWARNAIDFFILRCLNEQELKPALPADKRTLIRRATLDLTGLPPTPAEVDAFLADTSPNAFAHLVDRLLASPQYGERWGRHWLDVARFGESDGFEQDKFRPHAWPYRDYVIESLNADVPYDQFVREQIAGDVIEPLTQRGIAATGFLVAGPWDEIQNVGASKPEMRRAHEEQLEELIGAVSQTFLGMTVNCARCHDHKFDPIPQSDYYRLKAVFDGVDHGNRPFLTPEQMHQHQRTVEPVQRELAGAKSKLADWENEGPSHAEVLDGDIDKALSDGRFGQALDARKARCKAAAKPGYSKPPLTVQCWTRLHGKSGFNILVANQPKDSADHWEIYSYAGTGRFSAYLPGYEPAEIVSDVEITDGQWRHVAMAFDGSVVRLYVDARLVKESPVTRKRQDVNPGPLFIGCYPPQNIGCEGLVDEVRICRGIEPLDELPAAPLAVTDSTLALWRFDKAAGNALHNLVQPAAGENFDEELQRRREAVRRLERKLKSLDMPQVYAGVRRQPPVTHILDRGNAEAPLDAVTPGGLKAISTLPNDWGLSADASEAQRRLAFANWVTDPAHPLTARVLVNRVWHYHFGQGLVTNPSDLGFNGGSPSHPQLLDWLADWFVRNGWSIKSLHRLIMNSATYQQSSRYDAAAASIDSENRLLWRFAPRRLEAENVRDAMLLVSGELNPQIGGPSFQPFTVTVFNTHFYHLFDKGTPEYNRRTIYRANVNTARDPLLVTLDCPAPSVPMPKRRATTTTLQALSLMNDSFVVRQADRFARRLQSLAGGDVHKQVAQAFRMAYGRDPDSAELQSGTELLREHGAPALCWALINSSEFLYIP